MPPGRIRATAGAQQATVQPKRPKFQDLWNNYPVGQDADAVYALVGGEAAALHNKDPESYANACALRLSRAFNYGGLTITGKATGYKVMGSDKKRYLLRVSDMITFVQANFGRPEIRVTPKQGEDKTSDFTGKQGVLTFRVSGWGDATGHVTLWDGTRCGDHCYFVHDRPGVVTTEISYWELK